MDTFLLPGNEIISIDTDITTYNKTAKQIAAMIYESFILLKYQSKPTAAESRCKKPCKKMTNRISMISDKSKSPFSYYEFRFKEKVRVEKKVVVYTWFNFIVDVGSSLGLWLGLSALGILDLALEAFVIAKKWFKIK